MKLFFRAALALILTTACAQAIPVTLRVVDGDGKPVAGAQARIVDYADWPTASSNFLTPSEKKADADGVLTLDLRGPADKDAPAAELNGVRGLGGARVRAAGYGAANAILLAGENVVTLGPPAQVSGVVQDEAGQPIAGARVRLQSVEKAAGELNTLYVSSGLPRDFALTDARGRWNMEGVARGFATFVATAPNWVATVVTDVPLAEKSVVAEPIILPPAGTVKGRVLDVQGQPLAGVNAYWDGGYGSKSDPVYSDAKGEFVLDDVPLGENTISFWVQDGVWMGVVKEPEVELERQGETVDVGAVRQSAGLLLSGTLIDEKSKAPFGSVKFDLIGYGESLQTDAQGRFSGRVHKPFFGLQLPEEFELKSLIPVPENEAEQFDMGAIAVERKFALNFATPTENADAAMTAFVPLDEAYAEKAWENLKIRRISDLNRYSSALGARRVFEAARRFDGKANPKQIGQGLDDYLSDRARAAHAPAEREDIAREGVELLRRFDANTWSLGMAGIAIVAAQTEDDELRAWAGRWYDANKSQVKLPGSPGKVEWYDISLSEDMMRVGVALGRDDAQKYRDIWLGQIDVPNEKYPEQEAPRWGETLWQADPQWFEEIVGAWPAPLRMRALTGALAVETDAVAAKALLARLEKLVTDPAVVANDAAKPENSFPPSANALYRGRLIFARSMARVDAPAALDVMAEVRKTISADETFDIAAIIARDAIANGQGDIARRALETGLLETSKGGAGAPKLAMVAHSFDGELATRLMEVARKNAKTTFTGLHPADWSDVANFAFALREFDANMGRALLEEQWAKRQQPVAVGADALDEYGRWGLANSQEKLAWAMSIYDLPRALQWLSEIKDDRDKWNNGIERTRLAIIVAALAPPEERSLLVGETY